MDLSTTFEDFASTVTTDKRSQALDAGNIKLTYRTVSVFISSIRNEKKNILYLKNYKTLRIQN